MALLLVAVLLVGIASAAISFLNQQFSPRAMLQLADWENDGGFADARLAISPLEMDAQMRASPELYTFRSWRPQTGSEVGYLRSRPFTPPEFMAIAYTGFPYEVPNSYLRIVCEDGGGSHPIATSRNNNQWSTTYLNSGTLCTGMARIEARNADARYYIGLSTPFEVSALAHFIHTSVVPRSIVVASTWLTFLAIGLAAAAAFRVNGLQGLAVAFCATGGVAMLVLAVFIFAPPVGPGAAFLAGMGSILAVAFAVLRSAPFRERFRASLPLALVWLAYSIACVSFVSIFDNGAGSWTVNGLFTPQRWSTDNQLPMLLAQGLWDGTSPVDMRWGPWLAADRTPLLAAGLLVMRGTLVWLFSWLPSSFSPIAYEAVCITLLCSWILLVPFFARSVGLTFSVVAIIVAATTPFMLFNTLYIWPKLLGGSYLVIAFMLLADAAIRYRVGVLTMVACCAALAYLAHASNVFGLVPLALFFLPRLLAFGAGRIAFATFVALILAAPWLYWTVVLQPGGNALLRSALAGTFGFDIRDVPLLTSVAEAYERLTPGQWVLEKLEQFQRFVGNGPAWDSYGEVARSAPIPTIFGPWRVLDFYEVWRAMLFPVLGLGLSLIVRPTILRAVVTPVLIGFLALVLTVAVTLVPSYVHHMPYGSLLLIILSGCAVIGTMPRWLRIAFSMSAVVYAGLVWMAPVAMSVARVIWTNSWGIALAATLLMLAAGVARRTTPRDASGAEVAP